jgi:phosphohistidine swiveling domain-containing protein
MDWRVPDGDESRTWQLRSMEPRPRLELDWMRAYAEASMRCFQATGAFTCALDGFAVVDGWPYARLPDEPDDEVQRRRDAHGARGDAAIADGTCLWESEIQPEVEQLLRDLRRRRPRSENVPTLVAHVERCLGTAAHVMGDLHWRFAFSWTSNWGDDYARLTGGTAMDAAVFLQGIDHMTSRLVRRLRDLAKLRVAGDTAAYDRAFDDLLRRYGRRTGRGFGSKAGFRDGTWSMDPASVHDLVASYARADLDRLDVRERAAKRARQAAVRRLRRRYEGTETWPELERAHRAALFRVRGMEDHNHLMEQETEGTLREAIHRLGCALVAAGRIDDPDDVLHLGLDDLRAAAATADDLRPLVGEHRAELERQRSLEPPPFLGAPPPPPPDVTKMPGWQEPPPAPEAAPGTLVGTPASPGRATGRAVVAADTAVPPEVEPGDIVIARDAGPAWTPIFPLLGGLVLDDGWVTQHAAIVCREYGIPCVLATRTATTSVPHGSSITLDGTTGLVELVP